MNADGLLCSVLQSELCLNGCTHKSHIQISTQHLSLFALISTYPKENAKLEMCLGVATLLVFSDS